MRVIMNIMMRILHCYCISKVYVADLYWLLTTVETKVLIGNVSSLCIVSIHIVLVKQITKRRRKKLTFHRSLKKQNVRLSRGYGAGGWDQKKEGGWFKKEKKEKKNLKTVIHCCKCNGQNVSRVSIVKPCVLFSVFLYTGRVNFWCIMSSNVIIENIDPGISKQRE